MERKIEKDRDEHAISMGTVAAPFFGRPLTVNEERSHIKRVRQVGDASFIMEFTEKGIATQKKYKQEQEAAALNQLSIFSSPKYGREDHPRVATKLGVLNSREYMLKTRINPSHETQEHLGETIIITQDLSRRMSVSIFLDSLINEKSIIKIEPRLDDSGLLSSDSCRFNIVTALQNDEIPAFIAYLQHEYPMAEISHYEREEGVSEQQVLESPR